MLKIYESRKDNAIYSVDSHLSWEGQAKLNKKK